MALVFSLISQVTFASAALSPNFSDGSNSILAVDPEAKVVIGDLSGDGSVNSKDYSLMKRYLLNVIDAFPVNDTLGVADLNGDGLINSKDLSLMKRYLLGSINVFPKGVATPTPTIVPTPTPTAVSTPTPTSATPTPDTQPPSAPKKLTFTEKTSTTVTLSWSESTDNYDYVCFYDIHIHNLSTGTTKVVTPEFPINFVTISQLDKDTCYEFTIYAKDWSNNISEPSNTITVKTNGFAEEVNGTIHPIETDVPQTGSIANKGNSVYYSFTPSTDGEYEFFTTGTNDTYGSLYDHAGNPLTGNNDDNGNLNFNFSYDLKANETYYLKVNFTGNSTSGDYVLNVKKLQKVSTPKLSILAGTYSGAQTLIISCDTPGATIYYSTDKSRQEACIIAYSEPVTISSSTTIRADAVKEGMTPSDTVSATYTITP